MDGATIREGRVEVCSDGRWGTVCGEGWTNEDAGHVCSRLGYPPTSKSLILRYSSASKSAIYNKHYN